MVVTMKLQHVIQRGKTYHFRMPVPKDCIEKIGKREIVQSLKTEDPAIAKAEATKLEALWKRNFNRARGTPATEPVAVSTVASLDETVSFRQGLMDQIAINLPEILDETESELKERLAYYADAIRIIGKNDPMGLDLPEIGVCWPLKPSKSPRQDRQYRRDLLEVLELLRQEIKKEFIQPPSKSVVPKATPVVQPEKQKLKDLSNEHDIMEVANLMLAAKKRITKTKETVLADIRLLQEWTGNKKDITAYSKADLIDYIQNCLPYLPANISRRGNRYKGKTLRQCVEMTKTDPEQYPPISHTTCGNRLVNITMVFNYAKDDLGYISINPAKGIEIPEVNVSKNQLRGFTPEELTAMWNSLQSVKAQVDKKPSHYWTTVLSLYHGFRLNEVCSLFLKDVYEDADGVFVISINAEGEYKSVKNQSSVRIVPVHPFMRDTLGFKSFVEDQKRERTDGLLFTDVVGNTVKGYRDRMSKWFAVWKKEWLPTESQYKHFHDLRYTFTQTAQNSAKIPDRHSQEITGHTIEGVSKVHLGYSGRLKPVDLLTELTKVRYGWEASVH